MEQLNFDTLKQLLNEKKYREFITYISKFEEVDIAEFLQELDDEKLIIAFRSLPKDIAADVFSYLPIDFQQLIIAKITDVEINRIIEDLYIDDAVDMLDELPANLVKKVLKNASVSTRNTINKFLKYDDDTAGSIMTAEFIDLKQDMNVKTAIDRIRKIGKDKESIYTCYVIDKNRKLEGVISIKDLLLSDDDKIISSIMDKNFVSAKTSDDQETVANLFSKYDLLALPVVDNENRLVGIVTIDDAVDVISEEAEEDFEKMAALIPSETPYLQTSVFKLYKNRILWLIVLMFAGMISGYILSAKEEVIATVPILVSFIPMLNDTGGNCGSQTATIVIRGLTSGELSTKNWLKIWWKELRVALLVGITLVTFNLIRVMFLTPWGNYNNLVEKWQVALIVCLSLLITIIISKSLGALLPLLAKKLKLDPAVCASPLITTIVDASAILIYFALACAIIPNLL